MNYSNPLLVELVVPKSAENEARIRDFYDTIDWDVWNDSHSDGYMYVSPRIHDNQAPVIAYGLNPDPKDTTFFTVQQKPSPSQYTIGDSLPFMFKLVEICMAVPSDESVMDIFERGGKLLHQHTHIQPRQYYGVREFRFFDPFNYVLRVTANPGWEQTSRSY